MIRGLAHETTSPKYAHVERERRWLVDPARRPGVAGYSSVLIEDRYITGTRLRLRRMTEDNGTVVLKLTKKYDAPEPLARPIVTAYLDEAEYALFAALPATPIIKRRYAMESGGQTYSVDCFAGGLAGLELVEIEWHDDVGLRALPPPAWALREVSDDPRYRGGTLATAGRPEE